MRSAAFFLLVGLLLGSCDRAVEDLGDQPGPPDLMLGLTRQQVRVLYGEPSRVEEFTRTGGPDTDIGFGPPLECQYFRDLPGGSVVEVWYYDLEGDEGWLREVHFVQGTDAVVFHQYLEEMVVY